MRRWLEEELHRPDLRIAAGALVACAVVLAALAWGLR